MDESKPLADSAEQSSIWQAWLHHPEQFRLRNALFRIHYRIGAAMGLYVGLMSITGVVLVHRNELTGWAFMRWLADLHENLLTGGVGRLINGMGAVGVTLLCLTGAIIWWPGVKSWRRSLTITRGGRFSRMNWDLHSALGFWFLLFVLLWGVSATYFCYPRLFDGFLIFDPSDKFTDRALETLADLHFGRFNRFTEAVWTVFGLVPAAMAFTGAFICCRRMIFKKPSNPNW